MDQAKAYAIVLASMCAGLRCKKVRMTKESEFDVREWKIHLKHVKGEGTYESRDSIVLPEAWDFFLIYLRAREKRVDKKCPMNQALIPALRDEPDGFFSTNGIEKLKGLVERKTGIKFDLRTCWRTYGQILPDGGLHVESVSPFMGHSTTKTTEIYYARKKQGAAILEATRIWDQKPPNAQSTKNPLIEPEKYLPGYV